MRQIRLIETVRRIVRLDKFKIVVTCSKFMKVGMGNKVRLRYGWLVRASLAVG